MTFNIEYLVNKLRYKQTPLPTWWRERRPLVGRGWFSYSSLVTDWAKVDIDKVEPDELASVPWFPEVGTLHDVAEVGGGGDVGKIIISDVGKTINSGYLRMGKIKHTTKC